MARKKRESGPLTPKITPPNTAASKDVTESVLEYRRWRSRISRSKTLRRDWEKVYKVEECEKYILGEQSKLKKDIVFNYVLATIKTIKPNIFIQNPKFFIRPKTDHDDEAWERDAAIGEGLLDSISQLNNNLKNAVGLAIWQAFCRVGVLKTIHDPKMEPNPDAGEPMWETNEAGEPIMAPQGGGDLHPKPMIDPQTKQQMTEPKEIMSEQVYRFEWVDAKCMLFPDEGPDMSKWTWLAEEIIVSVAKAKKDPRFEGKTDQIKSNTTDNKPDNEEKNRQVRQLEDTDDENLQWFKYYEIYDIDNKKMVIIADSQDDEEFLYNGELPEGISDHPYSILNGFVPIIAPKPNPWPMPYILPWIDIQHEYNIRRKQITEGCKRSARKGVFGPDTFDDAEEAVKLFQDPDDMVFAKINNMKNPPVMLQTPELNASIFKDIELLQNDWKWITAQPGSRFDQSDANTATEANYVEQSASLREGEMLDQVNTWLSTAGRKMFGLVKETITLGIWVKLRGFSDNEFSQFLTRTYGVQPEQQAYINQTMPGLKEIFMSRYANEKWSEITREDLMFQADITVVPGSYRPHNLDTERSQWLQFLQLIGQFPQIAMSRELLKETASKFEYISDKMIDELVALAQKMMQAQQTTAGRNPQTAGATMGGQQPGAGDPAQQAMAGMMSSMMGNGAMAGMR